MKTAALKDAAQRSFRKIRPRFFPHSLAFRLFLLIFSGVLLAALLAFSIAQRERSRVIEHFHGHEAADRIADVAILLSALPPAERGSVVQSLSRRGYEWQFLSADDVPPGEYDFRLVRRLNNRMHEAARAEEAWRVAAFPALPPTYQVRLEFLDGQKISLRYKNDGRRGPPPPEQWRLPISMGLFVFLLALVSWFAVRSVLRPLRRMVHALEGFGRDIGQAPLDACGPDEVRQAAQAFNAMQERIRDYMAERTQILAAVTHDLKTPLTRMRLRVEQCPDENLKTRLEGDVATMQALIEDGLALARSMERNEEMQAVDLGALLQSLADDAADAGQDVQYEDREHAAETGGAGGMGGGKVRIQGSPSALHRLFGNLIDNAVKYGGQARIRLVREGKAARVLIRDRGPGIPEASLEEVQKPFFRLETSRSRETGGTGLGLAIAVNLAATHNARLELRNHPEGGLEASVVFPL